MARRVDPKAKPRPTPLRLIVKVQVPVGDVGDVFIYDEHHKVEWFVPPLEAPDLIARMEGRLKKYFYAKAAGEALLLEEEAPEQPW